MANREDFTLPAKHQERISKQGFDILQDLIQVIINAEMQVECQKSIYFSRFIAALCFTIRRIT